MYAEILASSTGSVEDSQLERRGIASSIVYVKIRIGGQIAKGSVKCRATGSARFETTFVYVYWSVF